jgi:DNA-directed RNA polymerase specialized sigma24 family protein
MTAQSSRTAHRPLVSIDAHHDACIDRPDPGVVDRLIDDVAGRDTAALATLYRILGPHLLRGILSHLPDPAEAGSVLCATFVEVWRMARHHAPAPSTGHKWVTAIATRRATEQSRIGATAPGSWQAAISHARTRQHHAELAALLAATAARPGRG